MWRLLHVLYHCYDSCRCLNLNHILLVYTCAFADVAHLLSYKVSTHSSQVSMHVHVHTLAVMFLCLLSLRALCDWFHHKSVLSSRPLKLWSHRYVCAAIAVRGTELFTSSSFSYSLTPDVLLYPFFLALLISSRSIHSLSLILPFFTLQCSLCLVFFTLPHSASSLLPLTPLLFLSPPHLPHHAIPPHRLCTLSLSSTVSPQAILSHHSSSFINTCTHAAQHAQQPRI